MNQLEITQAYVTFQSQTQLVNLANQVATSRSKTKPAILQAIQVGTQIRLGLEALNYSAFLTKPQIDEILYLLSDIATINGFPFAPTVTASQIPEILLGLPGPIGPAGPVGPTGGGFPFFISNVSTDQVIDSFPISLCGAAQWLYDVHDATNKRVESLVGCWLPDGSQFRDDGGVTLDPEIGNTSGISFYVNYAAGNIQLIAHVTSGTWTVAGSRIQIPVNGNGVILPSSLTNGTIWIGSPANTPAEWAVTGDISLSNAGVASINPGVIVDADISATAAISLTKLAALSPLLAVVTDGSGFLTTSLTTATQIGYLSNVTSDVQTQLNSKLTVSLGAAATGDILYYNGVNWTNFPRGTAGQVLSSTAGTIAWAVGGSGITNSAAANEMMKSDGTNAVGSKVFSLLNGNLTFGDAGFAGTTLDLQGNTTRLISADGSASIVTITLQPKNINGSVFIQSTTADQGIQLRPGSPSINGWNLTTATASVLSIQPAGGVSGSTTGGVLNLTGGTGFAGNNPGGDINLTSGSPTGTGAESAINVQRRSTGKLGFFNIAAVVKQSAVTSAQGIANVLTAYGLLPASVIAGGGTPAGTNGQVQFNNAGAFGANANFNWDNTNLSLTIDNIRIFNGGNTNSVFIGNGAGNNIGGGGGNNIAIGFNALQSFTTANSNIAIGSSALFNISTGISNIAIGPSALIATTTAGGSVAIGNGALIAANAANNVGIGTSALNGTTSGQQNVGMGNAAGAANTTGSDNTYLGFNSALQLVGSQNVAIGSLAGANHTAGSQNVLIGYFSQAPSLTGSGQLSIQNVIYGVANTGTGATISNGRIGIGTTAPGIINGIDYSGSVRAHVAAQGFNYFIVDGGGSSALVLNTSGAALNSRVWFINNNAADSILNFLPVSDSGSGGAVLSLTRGGNIGMGTTTPGARLDINASGVSHIKIYGGTQQSITINSTSNNPGFVIGRAFFSDDANTFFIYDNAASQNRLLIDNLGNFVIKGAGSLYVDSQTGAGNVTALFAADGRIFRSGAMVVDTGTDFVGIGTPTPTVRLDIVGNVKATAIALSALAGIGNRPIAVNATGDVIIPSLYTLPSIAPKTLTSSALTLTLDNNTASYIFTGAAPATWTMPSVATNTDEMFFVKNRGTAVVTIQAAGIDNFFTTTPIASIILNPGDAYMLQNDGTYWIVM